MAGPAMLSPQQLAKLLELIYRLKLPRDTVLQNPYKYLQDYNYYIQPKSYTYNDQYTHIQPLPRESNKLEVDYKNGTEIIDYSNNKYDDSNKKYDNKLPEYVIFMDELDHIPGDMEMYGTDYIKHNGRNFAHMRRMLQKLWENAHTPQYMQFDIDHNFKLEPHAIAEYIQLNFSHDQINEAHYQARTEYQGRGRPKGSRNRAKVFGQRETRAILDDPLVKDMPDIDANDQVVIPGEAELPQTGEMLDTTKFVTRQEFNHTVTVHGDRITAIAYDMRKIETWGHEVDHRLEQLERAKPTIIEIKQADALPNIEMGIQHSQFPKLVKMLNARLPSGFPVIPWVYGPAGTGKTTAAEMAAKVYNQEFRTNGTTLAKFEILGFVNTTGYQTTPFREAYENGYLYCADEMDSWAKEATVALNGALANGCCAFPDRIVPRHPNFRFVACANTVGQGATMDYVGRNKQDGATLDRVNYLYWPLDEALEDNLCANKDWLAYVRRVRNRVNNSGINPKPLITPRAAMSGAALLNAGLDWDDVIDMCLRKGLSDAQWNQIR